MRSRRAPTALVLLALVATGLVACGGDDKPLTVAEYRKEVNAICERRDRVLDDLQPDTTNGDSTAAALDKARPAIQDAADALEDLKAPSKLERDHERLTESIAGQAEESERLAPLLKGKEGEEVVRVSAREGRKLQGFSERIDRTSQRLRLDEC